MSTGSGFEIFNFESMCGILFGMTDKNERQVLTAALAADFASLGSWTAEQVIEKLQREEPDARPSDATVYRTLRRLADDLRWLVYEHEDRVIAGRTGRPRRLYNFTEEGREEA